MTKPLPIPRRILLGGALLLAAGTAGLSVAESEAPLDEIWAATVRPGLAWHHRARFPDDQRRRMHRTQIAVPAGIRVAIDGSVIADRQATSDVGRAFGIVPKRLDAAAILDPGFNSALPA